MLHQLCCRTSFLRFPQLHPRISFKYVQFSNLENNPLWPPYYCVKGIVKLSWTPSCEENLSNHAVGSSTTNTQCPTHCTTLHEWSQRTSGTSSSFMIPVLKSAFELYHISLLVHHPFPPAEMNVDFATCALWDALQEHKVQGVDLTEDMVQTVSERQSSWRYTQFLISSRSQKLWWGFKGFLRMQLHWASWGIFVGNWA